MKLEKFKLGERLERNQLEKIAWGGDTRSNGHYTKSSGDDCDTANSDTDYPASGGGDPVAFG